MIIRGSRFVTKTQYGPPASFDRTAVPGGGGGLSRSVLKKIVWRYIDFFRLYQGISQSDVEEMYNTYSSSDAATLDQLQIDLSDAIYAEAKRRGLKSKDVVAEFEAKAAAAGLPSATMRVGGDGHQHSLLLALIGRCC